MQYLPLCWFQPKNPVVSNSSYSTAIFSSIGLIFSARVCSRAQLLDSVLKVIKEKKLN